VSAIPLSLCRNAGLRRETCDCRLQPEVVPDPKSDAFYSPQHSGRCQHRNRWLRRDSEARMLR
jgi:hypothetical protein